MPREERLSSSRSTRQSPFGRRRIGMDGLPATNWWADLFSFHPHKGLRDPNAFANGIPGAGSKYKTFCNKCLDHYTNMLGAEDNQEVRSGALEEMRSQEELELFLWNEMAIKDAEGSLEDELRVYELLDLDAPGEIDPDFDLDEELEYYLDD